MRSLHLPVQISAAILSLALSTCAAPSRTEAPAEVADQGVALIRTFYVVLRPDLEMGKAHPPLDRFASFEDLPESRDGAAQLELLRNRFTLPSLTYQFSDTTGVRLGQDVTLAMGFQEIIRVNVRGLARAEAGTMTAEVSFLFGTREVFRNVLPIRSGRPLVFAGHLDSTLPILSVITLEFRMFPPDRQAEMQEFAGMAKRDRDAFAPPPPVQRDKEPYLPGVGDVTMPEQISYQKPAYPDAARPEKLDGQVIIEVVVDREGKATQPRILKSSSPVFDAPAFESAKTYRYKPATKNGKPVAVTMNLIMIFQYTSHPVR